MTWDDWMGGRYEPDPNSGCFLWRGKVNADGYAMFNRESYRRSAHRKSFEVLNGPIPDGMVVMHKCDTPCCINPDHLRLGTQLENIADRVAKKRCNGGRPKAKLSREDVLAIRARAASGEGPTQIAKDYPTNASSVCAAINRKTWKEIP